MQEGILGAAQAPPAPLSKAALVELDVYNARSIKLAEATRVRLFLPGLKGGALDEWEDPQEARAAAQAAAAQAGAAAGRTPADMAAKSRKKLAKVAALAHANEQNAAAGGGGGGGAGGGSGNSSGGGGEAEAGAGTMMVVEAIVVLEDDEDDDTIVLAASGDGEGEGVAAVGGFASGASGAQRVSGGDDGDHSSGPAGAGANGRAYTPLGAGNSGAAAAAAAAAGGRGGGRHRPVSAVGGQRPASAVNRRTGDTQPGSAEGGRLRPGPASAGATMGGGGSLGADPGVAAAPRVPVWSRLTANSVQKEKMAPPPPKVYRAVQGKTLSLGLGGPEDGSGGNLLMVADPAAPYYGVEPGNGSGAAAAANVAGRIGWPLVPPMGGWARVNGGGGGVTPMPPASRGGAQPYGTLYDTEYGAAAVARRVQDGAFAALNNNQQGPYGASSSGSAASIGPNVAFVRSRRLGSGASPGKAAAPPPPSPPAAVAAAAAAGAGAAAAAAAAAALAAPSAGPGGGGGVGSSLRFVPQRGSQLVHRGGSELNIPGAGGSSSPGVMQKMHSSELPFDLNRMAAVAAAINAGNSAVSAAGGPASWGGGGGVGGPASWGGGAAAGPSSWGGGGGGLGPPSSPARIVQQQQQGAVPTAWADTVLSGGGGAAGMSYNATRSMSYGTISALQGQLSPGRAAPGGGGGGGVMTSPGTRSAPLGLTAAAVTGVSGGGAAAGVNGPAGQVTAALAGRSATMQPPQAALSYGYGGSGAATLGGYTSAPFATPDGYGNYGVSNGTASTSGGAGPSRYGNVAASAGGAAAAAARSGGGTLPLYGTFRGPPPGVGMLFASGSTPQVTAATLAAVAAAAGAAATAGGMAPGGLYDMGGGRLGMSRLRSSSLTQLAPSQ